jgi:hypothetical protein
MLQLHSQSLIVLFLAAFAVELYALRAFGDRATCAMLDYAGRGSIRKLVFYPLIAPGVAVHELAHAVTCVAVGARLGKIVLFHPQTQPDGSRLLGYVQHSRARIPFGNLLVALAPIILPPIALYALAPLLVPDAPFALNPALLGHALLASPFALGTLLWAGLALTISLSAFPSDADFRGIGLTGIPAAVLALIPIAIALRTPERASQLLAPYLFLALLLLPSLIASSVSLFLLRSHRRR